MTEENKKSRKEDNKKKRSGFKIFLRILLVLILVGGIGTATMIYSVLKDAPKIDPTQINASLDQTSSIYDSEGNLIEKIETAEIRTFVSLDKMPKHLGEAFIAIEDERFYDHHGIDPKGIMGSMVENVKAGRIVRGASTITQQLAKNMYLTNEKKLSRKITEAYLAFKIESQLHKDQILEAYLNRNFFGNNAYGVQEASQTYFAKDVGDLTIAESAVLAGVVKGTTRFQPYKRIKPEDYDGNIHYQVGEADVLGEKYLLVYNPESVERQKLVLAKMKDLNFITAEEYEQALAEDIRGSLKPGNKKVNDITSYFSDFVKTETMRLLQEDLGYSKEESEELLFAGGLKIYSTIDLELQKQLEDVYENFTQILLGNPNAYRAPILIDWKLNEAKNIIDDGGNTIYFHKDNILDAEDNLYIGPNEFSFNDAGDLILNSIKLRAYPKHIDIGDYYRIDGNRNLVTHTIGSISLDEDGFFKADTGEIVIKKEHMDTMDNFYHINDYGNLIINNKYFYIERQGAVQPQSASVVMDYRTGHIKSIVGGRDLDGTRILNRATNSLRQPGSVIKPISVYLPALDNGFTAASAIDDVPLMHNGEIWPQNWYKGYRGIQTLRTSVEQSINVASVQTVNNIGYDTSMEYLSKMGIINKERPEKDHFVTSVENQQANDENPSALALGGMSRGLTPLEMTAAYGTIANDGVFIEPTPIIKILDKNGNMLLDNQPKKTTVVSPQIAYIMKDILNTTVTQGLAKQAQIPNMAVAGKTGTTQHQADIWFVGFTPYYVSGVWIGSDSPSIRVNKTSGTAAQLWKNIMTRAHNGLEAAPKFTQPEGIVTASVCTQSGKLPSGLCSGDPRGVVRTEIFAQGTVPTETCDVHVAQQIDTSTGKLATDYCPAGSIGTGVFIKRKNFDPNATGGIYPDDYGYTMPGYCSVHSASNPGSSEQVEEAPPEESENSGEENTEEQPNTGEENTKPKPKPNPGNGSGNGNSNGGGNDGYEEIPVDPNA